jgi:hypothetical protein
MTRLAAIVCTIFFVGVAPDERPAQRLDAIRHAKVWAATDVKSKDLKAGPQGPKAFAPGAEVTCTYMDVAHGSGSTPKFHCMLPNGPVGREIKVRYGKENGEVYAQVAATRLFWALGFPANAMYPVKVTCRGCANDPFNDPPPPDGSAPVVFDPAIVDVSYPGTTIEASSDEGWSWKELDDVDEASGGATRAERDALRLLAVFVQHSSNKPINQRLVCADPPACSQTIMMVPDLGKTFGAANAGNKDAKAAVNFAAWSHEPIWKDAAQCIGNLHWSWSGSLSNPRISEAGRKLLADQLNQLSDTQLTDLFTVARFTDRDPSATVAQWVEAFKAKRAEITNQKCAELPAK